MLEDLLAKQGLELRKKLGEGEFGKVYKAYDSFEDEIVAIKIIPSHPKEAEHEIFSQLRHPNIVGFKKYHRTSTYTIIVMEYLRHGSLHQYLRQHGQVSDIQASQIMKGLLKGVEYLHDQNVIHRDIKPENVFIGDPDNLDLIKIGDFGLSHQFDQFGKLTGKRCGTVIFMAPEQWGDLGQYSKPVDIWSCGIIMYMLLSRGQHPLYEQESREAYLQKIQNPVWRFNENFSDFAIDFFKKLVCMSTLDRYSAGQALRHPWITRNFCSDIPKTFQENLFLFQKKQQLLKTIKALMILQRFVSETNKQPIKYQLPSQSVQATQKPVAKISSFKPRSSVMLNHIIKIGDVKYSLKKPNTLRQYIPKKQTVNPHMDRTYLYFSSARTLALQSSVRLNTLQEEQNPNRKSSIQKLPRLK